MKIRKKNLGVLKNQTVRQLRLESGGSLSSNRRSNIGQESSGIWSIQDVADHSSSVTQLQALQNIADVSQRVEQHSDELEEPAQLKENRTGLPDSLKNGMESMTGHSLDHVKVHYNSSKPAALQAHAYAQGSEIHLGVGQQQHLPHELGHVVQQMEGRVRPTMSVAGVEVNDDIGLEREADVLGDRATGYSNKS